MTTEVQNSFYYDSKEEAGLQNQLAKLQAAEDEKGREMHERFVEYDEVKAAFDLAATNRQPEEAMRLGNKLKGLQQSMLVLDSVLTEHREKRQEAEKMLEEHKTLFTLELQRIRYMLDSFAPKLAEMQVVAHPHASEPFPVSPALDPVS